MLSQRDAEFGRAMTVFFLEAAEEMGEGAESAFIADLGYREIGGEQQIFGVFQP